MYLDELVDTSSDSIGLGIVKLVLVEEDEAVSKARSLINLVQNAPQSN